MNEMLHMLNPPHGEGGGGSHGGGAHGGLVHPGGGGMGMGLGLGGPEPVTPRSATDIDHDINYMRDNSQYVL